MSSLSLSLETIANLEKSCDYNTNNYFSGTIWEFLADIIVTNSKYLCIFPTNQKYSLALSKYSHQN